MENKYAENLFIMYLEQGSNYFRLAHFFVGLTTITLIYFMTFRGSSFSYHIISTKHNKQIQFELKSNKKTHCTKSGSTLDAFLSTIQSVLFLVHHLFIQDKVRNYQSIILAIDYTPEITFSINTRYETRGTKTTQYPTQHTRLK